MKTPYEEGMEARRNGIPIANCPYAFRTKEYASWRGGYGDEAVNQFYAFESAKEKVFNEYAPMLKRLGNE